MTDDVFVVDSFTTGAFTGNPAAVCLLETSAPAAWMQSIAAELNQPATAFLCRDEEWSLRWFTRSVELPLCGHGTLAAAHVLRETGRAARGEILFSTRAGPLVTTVREGTVSMRLPADTMKPAEIREASELLSGVSIRFAARTGHGDLFAVLESEEAVRFAMPDLARLTELRCGLVITARGKSFDCVSRYFVPAWGLPEDQVTGSAHCALAPYWSAKLGRNALRCYQASPRGGVLEAVVDREFVTLTGRASTVIRGRLEPRFFVHD